MATPPLSFPGVYVVEVPSGVQTITGVATSVAAFFGRTTKGPMDKPVRLLSLADFGRNFGEPHPDSDLAQSVKMFFDNGGTDCYVVRLAKGAESAKLHLRSLDTKDVLDITALSPGKLGDGIRLEVNYNTAQPDETFNLNIIQDDGGIEKARETYLALSMDPASPRFAPRLLTQNSGLIEAKLNPATDITLIGNSFAGFSQSRVFAADGAALGPFRSEFESILLKAPIPPGTPNKTKFTVSVDGSQPIDIDLQDPANAVFGPAGPAIAPTSAWTLGQMETRIAAVINAQLSAAVPGLGVSVVFRTSGTSAALRITAATGDQKSVRVTRAANPAEDFASAAMLGLDQGGVEAVRYSNFRPAPTAAFLNQTATADRVPDYVAIGDLTRDDVTSIAIGGETAIPFSFAPPNPASTPAATDLWHLDSKGGHDGLREKLLAIVQAVNATATSTWRAELWGYRLAFVKKTSGVSVPGANATATAVVSAPDPILGAANVTRNVRQYSLGTTGSSAFQVAAIPADAGSDGSAFTLTELQGDADKHTGLYALDKVDLFNLMVIPGDSKIDAATQESFWGPASIYCAAHRAFLLIDAPEAWAKNGVPEVVQKTPLITGLRNTVVKRNSAVFFPRLQYNAAGVKKSIGPTGAIAGLMSRIDATRGVWKAPAGIEADLRGIVDLDVNLTDLENGVLNKQAVNCSRKFASGLVNWGARTMDGFDDQGSEWKYIPIRRLALFLEESLFRGTKWVVFEPNDEPLWAKIRLNLNAFMMDLFRQGAFQGTTPDKAFFVKCDSETTTQNDRNLGIVNILVGFAPLKPAEFVILRIQQIAGDL